MVCDNAAAGSVVRSTTFIATGALKGGRPFPVGARQEYNSVPVFLSTPPCLTSLATPMTVNHGIWSPQQGLSRWPMGFLSFQKVLTNFWFTTATMPGALASVDWKLRP